MMVRECIYVYERKGKEIRRKGRKEGYNIKIKQVGKENGMKEEKMRDRKIEEKQREGEGDKNG